jgi:peptide/nickel transport system ATP-binding protein
VAVMYAGEIVETASAADLFAGPHHPYTRGLMASLPVPGRTAPGARLGAIPGMVPSLIGAITGCAFRQRCSYAQPVCAAEVPWQSSLDHGWRCIYQQLPEAVAA